MMFFPKKEKVSHLIRDGSDVSIYVLEKFKAKMAFYEKFLTESLLTVFQNNFCS